MAESYKPALAEGSGRSADLPYGQYRQQCGLQWADH